MIERLNVSTGDVVQVVRTLCMLRGACESKTLGFTCKVTACHMIGGAPVWEYEGRKKQCSECGGFFVALPDANLKKLPGLTAPEEMADPVSRREPIKVTLPPGKYTPSRSTPNAR